MKKANVLVLVALSALAAGACKEANTDYCADASAFGFSCKRADAAAQDRPSVSDARDAAEAGDASADADEAGDARGDLKDAAVEKPICEQDMDCPADGGKLACDVPDGGAPRCVECTKATHCKDAKKPVCDTTAHACVECVGTGTECTFDAAKTACEPQSKKCVECVDNAKCGAAKPICDTGVNACRICRADSECKGVGPGICVDWDGHCATAAEVVTLQGGAACTPAAGLYCKASDAVAALTGKTVLIIKGPDPVGAIDPPNAAPTPFLIVGQGGAVVAAGAGDTAGIRVWGAHKLWVRDLKVSGGTVGILAEGASELHVTRAVVSENGKGGIKTIDSGFDITNTIVAANMAGSDTGGVVWAGVRLGSVPTNGLARFVNNTVVDNKLIGVSCFAATYDTSTNIVYGNVGSDAANCAGAACCGAVDPKLTATYRLMSTSPCIDKLTANTMSPSIDIDGQPRPTAAAKLDCGADEFQ
jgi:hypothetical protein